MDELSLHRVEARDVKLLDQLIAFDPFFDRCIDRNVQAVNHNNGLLDSDGIELSPLGLLDGKIVEDWRNLIAKLEESAELIGGR